MAAASADLGVLAKQIGSYQVTNPTELRELTELCRVLCLEVAEVLGFAEFEVFEACRYLDRGSTRRAKQVTRPMKHAVALQLMAAKRAVAVYRTFLKAFSEELSAKTRPGTRRKFDWKG